MSHTPYNSSGGSNLARLPNETVSRLAPRSSLILTIASIIIFIYRFYVIEGYVMKLPLYKSRYSVLQEDQKRSLVNHHVAGTCKLLCLILGTYPAARIIFANATPHTPFWSGSRVTTGDVLIVCIQIFTAMYIFELFFRLKISPIGVLHHAGAIVTGQVAVALTVNCESQPDAIIEFMLCIVWGAFDCGAELWPHIAMIIYRLQSPKHDTGVPRTSRRARHLRLARVFLTVTMVEMLGTVFETAFVFWLWGSLWHRWTLEFKVVTPIFHVLFSIAQLWNVRVFWLLRKEQIKEAMTSRASDASSTDPSGSAALAA